MDYKISMQEFKAEAARQMEDAGDEDDTPEYDYEIDYLVPSSDLAQFYGAPAMVRDAVYQGVAGVRYRTEDRHDAFNFAYRYAKIRRRTTYLVRQPHGSTSLATREIIGTFTPQDDGEVRYTRGAPAPIVPPTK